MRTFLAALAVALVGCRGNPSTVPPPVIVPPAPSACDRTGGFRVHEWGTYTSVHASDGHALPGVHHEDEALPGWVHRRAILPEAYYLEEVTQEPLQQLETPVLYFYSDARLDVQVDVSFPLGVVGEWYPDATAFSPALGDMGGRLGGGTMRWQVTLDPSLDRASFPEVSPDEIWAPSRKVASTPVFAPHTQEREQFIFYRGLARFEPEVRTTVAADGTVTLTNLSRSDLPAVFLLNADPVKGAFESLGPLRAGASVSRKAPQPDLTMDAYLQRARPSLSLALAATGLCGDEAQAMVDTWTRSWFGNRGLRLLYLAPREWTDAWLPTTVTPRPDQLVRTLVGRIELLTPADEARLVAEVNAAAASGSAVRLETLGRFAEPRISRVMEQLTDPTALDLARGLRNQAHVQR